MKKKFFNLKNSSLIAIALLLMSFFVSCSDDSTNTQLKTLEVTTQNQIKYMMDTMIANRGIPGAIVMVEKAGYEPWFVAVGVRDKDTKEPLKPEHRFLVGSISKSFVVPVIFKLIEQGKLKLDDKLVDHLSSIKIKGIEKVTIRQLMGHTSGMGNYLNRWFVPWAYENRTGSITRANITDSLNTDILYFNPGDTVQYSNSAFIVLGLLAEKVGGQPIEDLVENYYIKPMGLTNSHFPKNLAETNQWLQTQTHGYAIYENNRMDDVTSFDPSYTWSAGAVVSNAYDLRLHLKEMLSGAKTMTPALQAEKLKIRTTYMHGYGTAGFGLGVAKIGEKYLGHSGGWIGYNTNIYHRLDKDTYILTFVNRYSGGENPAWDLFLYVNRILFPDSPELLKWFDYNKFYGVNSN